MTPLAASLENAAMQRYAGAELDLCQWYWSKPNLSPPWTLGRWAADLALSLAPGAERGKTVEREFRS